MDLATSVHIDVSINISSILRVTHIHRWCRLILGLCTVYIFWSASGALTLLYYLPTIFRPSTHSTRRLFPTFSFHLSYFFSTRADFPHFMFSFPILFRFTSTFQILFHLRPCFHSKLFSSQGMLWNCHNECITAARSERVVANMEYTKSWCKYWAVSKAEPGVLSRSRTKCVSIFIDASALPPYDMVVCNVRFCQGYVHLPYS